MLAGAIVAVVRFALPAGWAAAGRTPLVAAAADLQFALTEVARGFEGATGIRLRLAFGSSGNFARQIRQGAPFEVFFSADESYALALARAGLTEGRGALYALGRIALAVPTTSPLAPDGTLADLAAALSAGRVRRFAIANPEHAPYGRRAEEALKHAGLWEPISPHLVLGENVAQAAQFALSGEADGGIIAWSLACAPTLAQRGRFDLIPADWHTPLRQRMVLLKGASSQARAFFDHVRGAPARAILARYGFTLPNASG